MRLTPDLLSELVLDEEVMSIARQAKYMKGASHMTPAQVFAARLHHPHELIPTFMAQYGNQHALSDHILLDCGFFGHFLATDATKTSGRYWHPSEIGLMHGVIERWWLHGDPHTMWHIVGNSIATPHALITLINGLRAIGIEIDAELAFRTYHETKLQADQCVLFPAPLGHMLIHQDAMLTQDMHVNISNLVGCDWDMPKEQWWHPDRGWEYIFAFLDPAFHDPIPVCLMNPPAEDSDSDIDDTEPMHPMHQVTMSTHTPKPLWVSLDVHDDELVKHWYEIPRLTAHETRTLDQVMIMGDQQPCIRTAPMKSICVITDHDVSVTHASMELYIHEQQQFSEFAGCCYHQHGRVEHLTKPFSHMILSNTPWQHNECAVNTQQCMNHMNRIKIGRAHV